MPTKETRTLLPENLACLDTYATFGFCQLPEKIEWRDFVHVGIDANKDSAVETMRTIPRLQRESFLLP
ncbi:MAG: hypothetical protein QW698_05325 [Nitrososphaerales archaeon]